MNFALQLAIWNFILHVLNHWWGRPNSRANFFFISEFFSGKIGQIIGCSPTLGLMSPYHGKSLIRDCKLFFIVESGVWLAVGVVRLPVFVPASCTASHQRQCSREHAGTNHVQVSQGRQKDTRQSRQVGPRICVL